MQAVVGTLVSSRDLTASLPFPLCFFSAPVTACAWLHHAMQLNYQIDQPIYDNHG
jgi:hypothetical protein